MSRGRIKPLPSNVAEARGAPLSVPEPLQPGLAVTKTVAAQLPVAGHMGPEESGVASGGVNLKKSHSTPVFPTNTAIVGSGSDRMAASARGGIGARTWRALHVGKLICTVTSGVDVEATHTEGTETGVGDRHAAFLHHRSLNALIRLPLFAAIGGFFGMGVFHTLVERYHRAVTHMRERAHSLRCARAGTAFGDARRVADADAID